MNCRHDKNPDKCPDCLKRKSELGQSNKPSSTKDSYNDKLSRMRARTSQLDLKHGYRSGLEVKVGKTLEDLQIEFQFETLKLKWVPLPSLHTYNPDFILEKNGKTIVIESKGRFMPDDMKKHLAVKEQHPETEVIFVFQKANTWHNAKAKTKTYAKWCLENGFRFCEFRDFAKKLKEWDLV